MDRKQVASGETEEYLEGPLPSIQKRPVRKTCLEFYCEHCREMGGYEYVSADGAEHYGQNRPSEGPVQVAKCRNHKAHEEARKQAGPVQSARAKNAKKR